MNKFIFRIFALLVLNFSFANNFCRAALPIEVHSEAIEAIATESTRVIQENKIEQHWTKKIVSKIIPGREHKALAIVLTVLLPFLGIAVWQDAVTKDFWITLLLTMLLYLPGLIYAMSIILADARR